MNIYIYGSNWNTVLLNFSLTQRCCRNTPASWLFFKHILLAILFGCAASFTVAGSVVFLITLPPRSNKQLIRWNQGLWLVINDFFKGLFFISFCLFAFPTFSLMKIKLVKAKLWHRRGSCTTQTSLIFLLLWESIISHLGISPSNPP